MTLDEVVEVCISCLGIEDRDTLGWSWWALEGKPAGQVYAIDTDSHLKKTFAIKLLMAAENLVDTDIQSHVFPPSRELLFLIDKGEQSIRGTLKNIESAPDDWKDILSATAIQKIPALLTAFDNTIQAQTKNEEAQIIAAALNPKKIEEFMHSALDGFDAQATLNALGKRHGFLRDHSQMQLTENASPSWGYNQVVSKEAFIENWHVHYGNFGNEYGRGLARAEDARGFQALMDTLPTLAKSKTSTTDVGVLLGEAFDHLAQSGIKANAIITSLDFEEMTFLRQMEQFIPKWHRECPSDDASGFIGAIRSPGNSIVPVYRLLIERREAQGAHGICVVDLNSIGEMIRLFPGQTGDDPKLIHNGFFLQIVDLNLADVERKRILSSNPEWLNEYADKEQYLRGRALIHFYERLEYRFLKSAGIQFSLPKMVSARSRGGRK